MPRYVAIFFAIAIMAVSSAAEQRTAAPSDELAVSQMLLEMPTLTVTYAVLKPANGSTPQHGKRRFFRELQTKVYSFWNSTAKR